MRVLSYIASRRDFALGAELGFGHVDPKRFIDLARGMGIPAGDAARQVMGLITEHGRGEDPRAARPTSTQLASLVTAHKGYAPKRRGVLINRNVRAHLDVQIIVDNSPAI